MKSNFEQPVDEHSTNPEMKSMFNVNQALTKCFTINL